MRGSDFAGFAPGRIAMQAARYGETAVITVAFDTSTVNGVRAPGRSPGRAPRGSAS